MLKGNQWENPHISIVSNKMNWIKKNRKSIKLEEQSICISGEKKKICLEPSRESWYNLPAVSLFRPMVGNNGDAWGLPGLVNIQNNY